MTDLTGKPIELEALEELLPTQNDYTNEFYRQNFQRLRFRCDCSESREAELFQQVKLLRKQVAEFDGARKLDMAKIGEQELKIGELQAQLDKSREAYKELRTEIKKLSESRAITPAVKASS